MKNTQTLSIGRILLWMFAFLILYLPLLLIVIGLAAAIVWGIISNIISISDGDSVAGPFFVILALLAAGFFFAWPFLKAVFRPFFSLLQPIDRSNLTEITQADAPELVEMIHTIAAQTGNRKPKHIYLSNEVNAAMFFDMRFINIFLPIRKNIVIGVGLLHGTSRNELASVIAHEFGHFGQINLRWSSVVKILNAMIGNMMSINTTWNGLVNSLMNGTGLTSLHFVLWALGKIVGYVLYGLTIGYTWLMERIYDKIQMAYTTLCRQMEFEADAVAAGVAGAKTSISALYKMGFIAYRYEIFQRFTQRLAGKGTLVDDYYGSFIMLDNYLSRLSGKRVSPDTLATTWPNSTVEASLDFEAIYSTHPYETARISALENNPTPPAITFNGDARSILSDALWAKMGQNACAALESLDLNNSTRKISREEVKFAIEKDFFWYRFAIYLQRDIIPFDVDTLTPDGTPFNPDDKTNQMAIAEYTAALNDYNNAEAILSLTDKYKFVTYKNQTIRSTQLPIDTIREHYERTREHALQVDLRLARFAMARNTDPEEVRAAYRLIFYVQRYINYLDENLTPALNAAQEHLGKFSGNLNEHQWDKITSLLIDVNAAVYRCAYEQLDPDLFQKHASNEAILLLNEYGEHGSWLFTGNQISGDSINFVFQVASMLRNEHINIGNDARMTVVYALFSGEETMPILVSKL